MGKFYELIKGIIKENPIFVIVLGLCPTLAVSTSLDNAFGMGAAVIFVLMASNVIISLIRKQIPEKIRIPAFIIVIATFVTITDLVMKAYLPALNKALGIYVPLIVVNCIILGRAEAYASKNGAYVSLLDGIGMGIGFTGALVIISAIRELFGTGSLMLFGHTLISTPMNPAMIMILGPGAFITIALYMGLFNYVRQRRAG